MISLCILVWQRISFSFPRKCSRTPYSLKILNLSRSHGHRQQQNKSRDRTRAGTHYSYTVRTQQLQINPIPASTGDLITEKWPRRTVARSSFSDVINDLKIGGVPLTDTSLPVGAVTHPSEAP